MRLGLAQGSNTPAIQSVQSMPKDSFSGTTKISCARPSGTVWNSTEGQSAEAVRKLVKFSGSAVKCHLITCSVARGGANRSSTFPRVR